MMIVSVLTPIAMPQIHGVDADLARDALSLGFGPLDLDELMSMSIHGVTREFVEEINALGFG